MIDGKISQTDYRIFLTLVRNLQCDRKGVTYQQLADDLDMNVQNIGRAIRKLRDAHCLLVRKRPTESGYEFNEYRLLNPEAFDDGEEVISLLA